MKQPVERRVLSAQWQPGYEGYAVRLSCEHRTMVSEGFLHSPMVCLHCTKQQLEASNLPDEQDDPPAYSVPNRVTVDVVLRNRTHRETGTSDRTTAAGEPAVTETA